jgi:hypothetical protein
MPHVLDDHDVLEHPSYASESDDTHLLLLTCPASRRERSTLLMSLRGWILALRRRHTSWEQTCSQQIPQEPALSIDLLARTYPDIYRRITSWSF